MVNLRLISLIRKEFIQILRDPRTLDLVLVIPVMQLFLLGYAATNDVRNVPLAVYNQDHGPAARQLLDAYRAADYFRQAYEVYSEEELRELIDQGKGARRDDHPARLQPAESCPRGRPRWLSSWMALIQRARPRSLAAAQLIGQQYATQLLVERLARRGLFASVQLPVEIRTQVWYNPDLLSAYFMIPGLIGMILSALTSILTATAIVRERERGTIEQLIVTPIRSWELMVGKLLPYTILAILNTLEVLLIGYLVVPGAGARRPGADPGAFGYILALQPGNRPAGFHDRQYAARSDAHRMDDAPAEPLSLGLLFPAGSYAEGLAGDLLPVPLALLPGDHSLTDVERDRD